MIDYFQAVITSTGLQEWLVAIVIATTIMFVARVLRYLITRHLQKLITQQPQSTWQIVFEIVRRTKDLFILIIALFIGSLFIETSDKFREVVNSIMVITVLIQAGLWASVALRVTIDQYRQQLITKDPASVTTLNVLNFVGKVVLWAFILLLALDNLGVDITTLIAGLGVGGIAIALAVQTILGDLFASLSIVLDKPFVIGDFLGVGDLMGTVQYVGLKTTRLQSLSGEQLVFSNSDLLHSRIRNFGRMYERRVVFDLGVTYQTPRDKLIKIPGIIRAAVEGQDNSRFDRSHFKKYGDFSLNFESVYYVKVADYNTYMDIQQAINFYIHEAFERESIEFAYPTQTLYVRQP